LRSLNEISFRARQEIANIALLIRQNKLSKNVSAASPLPWLPAPSEIVPILRNMKLHQEIDRLARSVLAGRIPVFGREIDTGRVIRWRRDYRSGIETGLSYFRRIPYLDVSRAGDHKIIWELNRHQHLALLAQAYALNPDPEFLREIVRQLDDWIDNNPLQRGINWASALEVAFRSLSWCWIFHLAGNGLDAGFRARFLNALYQHGLHLEQNLSIYFSPNTHLLGEAVALHALGRLFPQFPRSQRWVRDGARIVIGQLDRQVHADGSHFEQSTYYHVYALDMFLFHFILAGNYAEAHGPLERMAAYLAAIVAPDGALPLIGDDDGGRFFYPYADKRRFGLATLATCGVLFNRPEWIYSEEAITEQAAWWIGPRAFEHGPRFLQHSGAALFADAGVLTLRESGSHLIFDSGPFGPWSAGHSHSDTLSVVLSCGSEHTLIDPGTYSYSDRAWRDRFRGSAAHNTIRVDGQNQAVSIPPFAWTDLPAVRILKVEDAAAFYRIDGECANSSFRHRRALIFARPDLIWIFDAISGPEGAHSIEQFWHPGEPVTVLSHTLMIGAGAALTVDSGLTLETSENGEYGWISNRLLHRDPASVLRASISTNLPCVCLSVIDLRPPFTAATVVAEQTDDGWILKYRGNREAQFYLRNFV
jgi:Heparinase II/III-like protein/Heparinase II/III N-terminus